MAEHLLTRTQTVSRSIDEVFAFFSDAANLERITPPELKFHIVTPQPIKVEKGTLIDYELRMRGLPFNWRTEITEWAPPVKFTDRQLRGPYRQWIHKHTFTALGPDSTRIEDEVRYRLPLEPFGDLAHFFVRRELDHIFAFRQAAVVDLLGR